MLLELGAVAARVGLAGAALLAWHLAAPSRSPHFRPVASVLSAAFAADGARALLQLLVLGPARAAGRVPYVGPERVAFHLEELLWLSFPALSVALALHVFARRSTAHVWTAWASAWAVLVIAYPTLRGDALLMVYGGAHLASIAVQLLLAVVFFARRGIPMVSQRVALALFCSDIAQLIGPWATGKPLRDWYTCQWPAALVWLVVLLYQWRAVTWSAKPATDAARPLDGSHPSCGPRRFSPSWPA